MVRLKGIGEPPNPFQNVTLKRAEIGRCMPHIVPYPKLRLAIPSADRKWRDHECLGLFKLPHQGNQVIPKRWVPLPPRTRGRARMVIQEANARVPAEQHVVVAVQAERLG
jgi:hypothetical protein